MRIESGFRGSGFSGRLGEEPPKLAGKAKLGASPQAIERMQRAKVHLERAVRASDVLVQRFDDLIQMIGPERSDLALEQMRSYVQRASAEYQKTVQAVEEMNAA